LAQLTQEVFAYLQTNPIAFLGIALIAGFAGCKTVVSAWRANFVAFFLVGVVGLFLSQLVIASFFKEYIEKLPQFQMLFNLIAAYIGSFIVAAVIHFIKPV
jgi:uncharacterized membrane protein YeaQ/YmgE (transglycosylase-associated protein family)